MSEEKAVSEQEATRHMAEMEDAAVDEQDPDVRRELAQRRRELGDDTEQCPTGGLLFSSKLVLAFQRKVLWEFVKSLGWSIAQGKATDLVSLSLPVKIFEPRSFLQRMTDGWWYATRLLNKAAASSDPVCRLKCVIAFAIGGLRHSVKQWKPFNPILGETYEAGFSDGTSIHMEQTSHHPPVSHWQMIGPDGAFHFYGYARWEASLRGNAMRGDRHGPSIIEFADGQKVSFTLPYMYLHGMLWGDRIAEYLGEMKIKDRSSGLECTIVFNPEAVGYIKSFFVSQTTPTDLFRGEIKKNGETVSTVSGSWVSHIDFDKERFFDFNMENAEMVQEPENTLESDCRRRADLVCLSNADYAEAAKQKKVLEEKQRRDRKLRAKHREGQNKGRV